MKLSRILTAMTDSSVEEEREKPDLPGGNKTMLLIFNDDRSEKWTIITYFGKYGFNFG